ncbi:unnamed protein product [Didymodactylos carnosus]|uniref:Uncharacterized protein n=1 Tax=Didymodactylos carnosus TaxID=1234261 RepID=A0A8S2DAJ7_9BILA|nr:unnamed protein product [Didymodactylos carnosus]CAF3670386.1 unnamed protein product [Didymodactylos carnosus]
MGQGINDDLQKKIDDEVSRATAAEGVLDGKITAEVSRATAAEGVLDGKITAEVSRATAAEGVLDGKITAEVSRATAAENDKINKNGTNNTIPDGVAIKSVGVDINGNLVKGTSSTGGDI